MYTYVRTEALAEFPITQVKIYTSNFDISCMGKWVPRLDTRGAYPIFRIEFDSEVKILQVYRYTSCKISASIILT